MSPEEDAAFVLELIKCPAGGEHDVHALEVIPAEGPEVLGHDVDGGCIKCGEIGFPIYIAPTFCRCGAEITHHGYGWCSAGCPDEERLGTPPAPVPVHGPTDGR